MNKLTLGLIIALVLANIATLTIFWMGRMHKQQMMRPADAGAAPKDFLIRELDFNADQRAKYNELVSAHRKESKSILDSTRQMKERFFGLLKTDNPSDELKEKELQSISGLSRKLDLLTFEHFRQVRALCTEDQKEKFDTIIHEVMSMMNRQRPRGQGDMPPPRR